MSKTTERRRTKTVAEQVDAIIAHNSRVDVSGDGTHVASNGAFPHVTGFGATRDAAIRSMVKKLTRIVAHRDRRAAAAK